MFVCDDGRARGRVAKESYGVRIMLGFQREFKLDGEVQSISERGNTICNDLKFQMTLKELSASVNEHGHGRGQWWEVSWRGRHVTQVLVDQVTGHSA